MNINLQSYKIKNSEEEIFIEEDISIGKICYGLINKNELIAIKDKEIILENNLILKIDNTGKIFEFLEYYDLPLEEIHTNYKFTPEEFLEVIRPLFIQIEEKIISLSEKKNISKNKILFTILSIEVNENQMYLNAAKKLANEILMQTKHDVLISTNNINFFNDIKSNRVKIRNNINKNLILSYGGEFNYNLKHNAIKNIPKKYDYIIYLDCDIKLDGWNELSDDFFETKFSEYDFGADRLNCYLHDEVLRYVNQESTLFTHKIKSYDIVENYSMDEDIMNSRLPSEHFFILKNDSEKVKKFQKKWEEMNVYLQNKNGEGGSWGDGFEIGVSSNYAGFNKIMEIGPFYWQDTLGFKFNGNKL
jgi:hypothetical protein